MQVQRWTHGRTRRWQKLCFQRVMEATTDVTAVETRADPPGEGQPGTVFQPFGGISKTNSVPSPGNTTSGSLGTSSCSGAGPWSRQEQHKA